MQPTHLLTFVIAIHVRNGYMLVALALVVIDFLKFIFAFSVLAKLQTYEVVASENPPECPSQHQAHRWHTNSITIDERC